MAVVNRLAVSKGRGRPRQRLDSFARNTVDTDYPTFGRPFYHVRTPVAITTRAWLRKGFVINCHVNPSEANWTIPRRESSVKTAAGLVRNTWRNRNRGTYFDTFPVAFTFQAGNIMPITGNLVNPADLNAIRDRIDSPSLPPGLDNFYRFLNLVDQGSLAGTGANSHIVYYRSRVFPSLRLEGFFTPDSLTFNDSSQNGNTVTWQATLMVHRVTPKLSNYTLMRGLYTEWLRNTGAIDEAVPIRQANAIMQRSWEEAMDLFAAGYDIPVNQVARTKSSTPSKFQRFRSSRSGAEVFSGAPEDF